MFNDLTIVRQKPKQKRQMKHSVTKNITTLLVIFGLTTAAMVTTPASAAPSKPVNGTSIVDVALAVNAETGEFSTLIAAVVTADLVGALDAVGQRTVFAPTDAAFADLGLTADNISDVPVEALTDILLYHVANGSRLAEDVLGSSQIRMLNGGRTTIEVEPTPSINGAGFVAVDIVTDNGVIHIIDAVLLPE
jgi:uncharacterized surface protein with fasciclin (FAS1) repeats